MQSQAAVLYEPEVIDSAVEADASVDRASVGHAATSHAVGANIPIVDLREYAVDRAAFVQAVGSGYEQHGFVGFTHHGVDADTVSRAYAAFKAFFALPEVLKRQYHLAGKGGARGYTGFGVERAKDHHVPDLKEFWHIGREMGADNPFPDILLSNVWPREITTFQEYGYQLYQQLDTLGRTILSILAQYLGLPADWFATRVNCGNSILRPIHYPPMPNRTEPGQVRAASHEDINLITLLLGSDEAGLEILGRDEQWYPVTTIPGTIVVNIGDMLQRLTNHRLPSTTHRVVNPPSYKAGTPRYSIPFFMHPNPDMPLDVLPQCVDASHPNRYPESITANGYLMQRLKEINLL